jgi:SAM-dependent methyltransferase
MSQHLTDRDFWESFWRSKNNLIFKLTSNYMFGDLLARIVKERHAKTAIELGGFPGYYSVYFRKYLNLEATLFDYFISKPIINELLAANGLQETDINVIEADIFKFQPEEKYDIVSSFGLIEHFTNIKEIISTHIKFLKPGGTLFITLPNFKSVNGWLQQNLDQENYLKHNIDCMDPALLKSIAEELGLKNIKSNYHGKFSVWLENKDKQTAITKTVVKAIWYAGKIFTTVIPVESKALSPYIVLEARLPD